ncbi:MAG TPA: helicase C-terminal domain-containing protein [Candidatus Dormibacteraeota bacterium]|jgi:predicted DnaQ family exonuclease/DinG family helicase|nr:helicase C-terminal domain-containing protein [Candidatus Dormibacteraeota bacterium]
MGSHAGELVAFDLETTGLSPKSDRVIEIGAVRLDADLQETARLELLVDPAMPIPLAVQRLTGLTDRDVRGGLSAQEAMAQFADFSDGATLIAHGGLFDIAFCAALLPEAFASRPVFDTLDLARILLPVAPSHSLPLLSTQLDIEHTRPHRALSDAETTGQLFRHLVDVAETLPAGLLGTMRGVAAEAPGPLRDFFAGITGTAGAPAPPAPITVAPPANGSLAGAAVPQGEMDLAGQVAALLGPDGPLARRVEGYEYRDAQVQMARAVAQTLERGGRLLVEAGTGVGKSLAYLLPLALWTQRTGRRAVVATNTVTLQEQLAEKDVAILRDLLPTPPEVAVLKGRQHYISLRRWERFLATPSRGPHGAVDLDVVRFKLKLLCWLAQTATGDRSELRLAGPDEALWQRVQSVSEDCLGAACANWRDARCFMVAARRQAARADLVITNHALLLADAERDGQVLGPYGALVVDEAHHLEESATEQLGASLRAAEVLAVLDRLGDPRPGEQGLDHVLATAREATQRLFGDVKGFLIEQFGNDSAANGTLGLRDVIRQDDRFLTVQRAALHAVRAWRDAAGGLVDARGSRPFQGALFPQPDRLDDELGIAAQALLDAAAVVERVVLGPREDYVAWLELRAEQAELHEAPVDVAEQLRRNVFDRVDAAVLTSATLSVAGDFDYVRQRTGAGEQAADLLLDSPFDFLSQALAVLPTGIPPYDDEGYDQALADLVAEVAVKLRGRTLVLFTGYSPLKRVHAILQARMGNVGIAVLGQGLDGTRRQVLASFLQNPRTVLLGTTTFWEGIDIPGDGLSCVVIAKLPFPVPTDPLVQARGQRLADPFRQLALPEAVLRLKQGFGRLIRHGTDRGAVVLCDARLSTREYGRAFLDALPRAGVARVPLADVGRTVEDFVVNGVAPPPPGDEFMTTVAASHGWEDEPA